MDEIAGKRLLGDGWLAGKMLVVHTTSHSLPSHDMSSPQQILHLVADLDGYGLTRQLELLVTAQLAAGQKVRVVALKANRVALTTFKQLGVDCRVLDRRWQRDPFVAVQLAKELRWPAYDLLHLWGQGAVDYFQFVQRVVRRVPMLATLPHESDCIRPGIAPPKTSSLTRPQFFSEQHLSKNSTLIAVAGPLTRSQCIDEAIWNFELVRTLDENVRLLIFGDGPDRHRLERFARLTSEPSAIRFMGYRPDFRELLTHVDLFWHTADADEGLPSTVLEAMAANVPVVANDGPGCRRILSDGCNGYLVPDNDRAIFARHTRQILQDTAHAEQLVARAAAMVAERFSVKASVEAMTQAYAERYGKLLDSRALS